MIKLAHESLESSQDLNGHTHRACLDPTTHRKFPNFHVYSTMIFCHAKHKYGNSRHCQKCVSKFLIHKAGHQRDWTLQQIERSRLARLAARQFLKTVDGSWNITFLLPQSASLCSVATLSKLRSKDERFIFEDKLANFTHFVDRQGQVVIYAKEANKGNRLCKMMESKTKQSLLKLRSTAAAPPDPPDQRVVTPTCPPWEYTELPSYDDLYGSVDSSVLASSHNCDQNNNLQPHTSQNFPHHVTGNIQHGGNIITPSCPPWDDEDSPPRYEDICRSQADSLFNNIHDLNANTNNNLQSQLNYFNSVPSFPVLPYPPQKENTNAVPNQEVSQCACVTSDFSEVNENPSHPHSLLTSFIHFHFCLSQGKTVMANLKGQCEEGQRYTLTTPTFHSLTGICGDGDEGEVGMERVIGNHVCSTWCRYLPSMQQMFQQAKANTNC